MFLSKIIRSFVADKWEEGEIEHCTITLIHLIMKRYQFECYFRNTETGERGWSIEHVFVYAENRDGAKKVLNSLPDFDCIIDSLGAYDIDMANLGADEYAAMVRGYKYINRI